MRKKKRQKKSRTFDIPSRNKRVEIWGDKAT